MRLGMVGLGRMGANMTRRLMRGGHEVVVTDLSPDNVKKIASEGVVASASIDDFVSKLGKPRIAWLMVPAGGPAEQSVQALSQRMQAADILIDGGNSYFKDDGRRSSQLKDQGIHYVDVGTSGGVWGLESGYCMMIGGPREAMQHLDPIFKTLAPGRGDIPRTPGRDRIPGTAEEGYIHCGPSGSGRFVKMVHNGIEYRLMQAYAEGFDILRNATSKELPEEYRYDLNVADVAEVWRRGSVVGSWLLDLTAMALAEDPTLSEYSGYVAGFRRSTLDHPSRYRRSGAGQCAVGCTVHALPFAPATHFCGKGTFRHAAEVRRSRGAGCCQEVRVACSAFCG
jgi:6-phosphogluconate dehydrogenase